MIGEGIGCQLSVAHVGSAIETKVEFRLGVDNKSIRVMRQADKTGITSMYASLNFVTGRAKDGKDSV